MSSTASHSVPRALQRVGKPSGDKRAGGLSSFFVHALGGRSHHTLAELHWDPVLTLQVEGRDVEEWLCPLYR